MRKLMLLVLTIALSGCATDPYVEGQRLLHDYGPECQAIGYQPNTDAFRNCVLKLHSDEIRPLYPSFPYRYGWP